MHNLHTRNTVRYYILAVVMFLFLFFSNDFGVIDVQKTAIVMAAGIDREEDGFILTSQVAIPQASKQGSSTEAVQIVSRGKTVAEAFEEINAKTGWYPKLVFCNLVLLGKDAATENVFDALDYFLRDEYLTDNCLVAVCDGYAKDLLNVAALVDPSSSVAIGKVLSDHAARVGTVRPATLREFSVGYFGDAKSGFLPVLKTQPQQEKLGENPPEQSQSEGSSGGGSENSDSDNGENSGNGGEKESSQNKPVFSAQETALFVNGKWADTLTPEQTFALGATTDKLRLAPYSVQHGEQTCTLTVKRNEPKIKLTVRKGGNAVLKINVTLTAGILDYSKALPLDELADVGDVPSGVFSAAEKKLAGTITELFEKSRACGCDLFGVQDKLVKYEKRKLHIYKDTLLGSVLPEVTVRFRNVR